MTSSFSELRWVNTVSSPAPQTKPVQYKFDIDTEEALTTFSAQWGLKEEEVELLRLTELQGYTRSQIASTLGVSRQNVSQKLCNLHKRIARKMAAMRSN